VRGEMLATIEQQTDEINQFDYRGLGAAAAENRAAGNFPRDAPSKRA
jgi:hypothetical protein